MIFGVITFALSLSLSTALRAHDAASKRENDAATVRAVFSIIGRDIQGAFISKRNPASIFVANNGGTAGSGAANAANVGGLLSLTTFAYRIQQGDLTDPNTGQTSDGMNAVNGQATVNPQADFALVRYDLDPSTRLLTRSVVPVPNLDLSKQPASTPDAILSDRVVGLTLRFYDPTQKTWRNEWDFQQQNQGTTADATSPTGTDPSTNPADPLSGLGSGSDASGAQQQATGDTSFPTAVEVTVTILRSDNTPQTYTSMIPVNAPYLPQDPPATNAADSSGGLLGGTTGGIGNTSGRPGGSGNAGGTNSNGTRPRQ